MSSIAVLSTVVFLGQVFTASAAVVAKKADNSAATISAAQLQVLTIGDSIMNGHGLPDGDAWPYLIANSEGWTVTNAACDGAGVLSVGSCGTNFAGIIDSVSLLQPDIVIFEGSSNDFGYDNSDLLAATISELETIRADFPNAQIVGLSAVWGYTAAPDEIAQINSQVQEAVTQVGGTYVDIGQPMANHPELMQPYDVHPTAAGQAVLAATIQAAIQATVAAALQEARADIVRVDRLNHLVKVGLLQ